jgi:diacylglycerol kinase family enzyme
LRHKVLINPEAGSGRGRKLIPDIKKLLYKDNLEFEPFEIEKESDMVKHVLSASQEEYDSVIVVGGDGTVRNALKGFKDQNLKLGIIPVGNCNSFARACKISPNYRQAVTLIKKEKFKKADYGVLIRTVADMSQPKESPDDPDITMIEEVPFCSCLSIGPGFMVADDRAFTLKEPKDRFMSIAGVFFKEFLNYPMPELVISYLPFEDSDSVTNNKDSEDSEENITDAQQIENEMNESKKEIKISGSSLLVSNVAETGSVFKLSRGASPFNHHLTMGLIKGSSKMNYFKYFYNHIKDNKTWELPFVEIKKIVKIKVSSVSKDVNYYIDREEFGQLPLTAQIRKEAVEVFVK